MLCRKVVKTAPENTKEEVFKCSVRHEREHSIFDRRIYSD